MAGNSTENASDIEFLLGPRRDHLYVIAPVSVCYAVIFLTGVAGNISTCIVIARSRAMHTATNFYLFSLAISDLLLLVLGLPQEFYELWSRYPYVFGETFCIIRGLGAETSSNASILTITAFTVERYVAICHPIKSHTMSRPSRAVKLIVIVWFLATLCAVPLALQFGIVHMVENISESASCAVKKPLPHSFEIMTILFFFLPMTVLTVFYVLIGAQLRKSTELAPSTGDSTPSHQRNVALDSKLSSSDSPSPSARVFDRRCSSSTKLSTSRRSVLRMLVAVVVAFFVCWAPHHTQRIFSAIVHNNRELQTKTAEKIYYGMTYVSGVMYYLSATINPILYNIMSHRFRAAFLDTFLGAWACITCNKAAYTRNRRLGTFYRNGSSVVTLSRRYSTSQIAAVNKNCKSTAIGRAIPRWSETVRRQAMVVEKVLKESAVGEAPKEVDQQNTNATNGPRRISKSGSSISNSSLQMLEDDDIELNEYVCMMTSK